MKLRKYIFSILFIFALFLLWNTPVYAGDLQLKNLNYDVTLNSDGTANVKESWDISIDDTNTLFKTFEIDKTKYSDITNVSLVETTKGTYKPFTQIYQEKYHVDKDCFYALINSKGQFEVAWGVHEDDDYARRSFEMSYTIIDAVKNYADCSEFYWQFISTKSAIPARKVTGTITLPTNVINNEDFRVWAHGPLNGNITKISSNTVIFEVENLSSRTMLETRVVTPTYVFEANENTSFSSKLDSILSQEQEWADEANRQREAIARRQKIMKFITIAFFILTNVIGVILCFALISKIKKYKKQLEEAPNIKPTMPSKYYRDIPNEKATPADAAFLYYFKNSTFSMHIPEVISATMLDLCMKKYLGFEVSNNKKDEIKVILTPNMDISLLPRDEIIIYQMLEKVNANKEFTMKEFEKYCKNHSSSFIKQYNSIEPNVKNEVEFQGNYDKKLIAQANNWAIKGAGFTFLAATSIFFMIASIIPSIICCVYCFKISGRYNTLTQKGVDEKEAWNGLKNYMEDFSMMKEKEVPELALWEKYLVFATAFGISDKVLKQLKVVYPQITDTNYMNSHGYSYLHYMYNINMSSNFIHSINSAVTTTYNSVNYSSGSGSGGGFSGGGGGGGGGGRNGRTLNKKLPIRDCPNRKCVPNQKILVILNYLCYYYINLIKEEFIMTIFLIILAIVVVIALFVISVYNGLVKARQKVKNAWSQIEVQLQRRFDLIPNLVETVKGYMTHESETLEKVTALRSSWANATNVEEKANLDNQLSGVLKTIMAVSENYPDLKANTNFTELQNSLTETENKISFSRQFYNDTVTMYNTKIAVFPDNIVASIFGFKAEPLFNVDSEEARKNVKVDFNK